MDDGRTDGHTCGRTKFERNGERTDELGTKKRTNKCMNDYDFVLIIKIGKEFMLSFFFIFQDKRYFGLSKRRLALVVVLCDVNFTY